MDVFLQRALGYAQNRPEQVIIVDKWRSWTWLELVETAAKYSATVRYHFISNSNTSAIPILVGRSGNVIAAVLGVLMAGYAAAPISSRQPAARIQQCLHQLGATAMLDGLTNDEHRFLDGQFILLEPEQSTVPLPPVPQISEESLLYVLFTSGSTGEPKGVMVSHANILNTILWSTDLIDWRPEDVMGGATQFSFDIANFDLFTCFYYGVPISLFYDPSDVHEVVGQIQSSGVTSIFAVPAFFSQFVRADVLQRLRDTTLRRIMAGGDFFVPAHVLDWRKKAPQVEVFNVWGPTETSIVNTMHQLDAADLELLEHGRYCSIGESHPRMPFILVDEAGREVTQSGERGEIWMLGDCVSQGYLGDTRNENSPYVTYQGQRAFRTHDIGYLDDKGNLYMAGRAGSIVKIAGYRIDLGDVESALGNLPEVHLAGAFVNDTDMAINELWAAVELKPRSEGLDVFTAKRALRRALPSYMVPKRILTLPSLPLNQNGKVDRKIIKALLTSSSSEEQSAFQDLSMD